MRNPGHRQPHLHTGQGAQQAQVIEVAEMARNPAAPQTTPRIIPVNQRDDWVFDHSFRSSFDYFGAITLAPDGTLFTIHEKGVNSGDLSAPRTIHVSYDMARTFEPVAQLPAGGYGGFLILRSGRWICTEPRWHKEGHE